MLKARWGSKQERKRRRNKESVNAKSSAGSKGGKPKLRCECTGRQRGEKERRGGNLSRGKN